MSEYETIVQFLMVASAVWLFVHLAFGKGSLREALLISLLGALMLFAMQGQPAPVFVGILIAGGIWSMDLYDIEKRSGYTMVLLMAFIGLFLFSFG